jgi:peptidoglycan pentaglycine glycine transferase (the first glycine)
MQVKICDNSHKKQWDEFILNNANDFGLLQSWSWGVLQDTLGKKVFRIVVSRGETILAAALVIKQPLKLGKSYFYIPRGPVIADDDSLATKQLEILEELSNKVKAVARSEKVIFTRLDPAWKDNDTLSHILEGSGLKHVGQVQPSQTLILNLSRTEEELLADMKSKTRYNIKLAKKHDITIDRGEKYFGDFWNLMEQTSDRQTIVSHPKGYYRKLLQVLSEAGLSELTVARYDGQVIAANLMVSIGHWSVYLHGASNYQHRDKMAPFLLQWDGIIRAKNNGQKYYDFWGVDEDKWPGITRFKKGFAPKKEFTKYIGAWDDVYSLLWYNLYKLLRK